MKELEFKPSFFSNNRYHIKLNLANTLNNLIVLFALIAIVVYYLKDKTKLKQKI